MTKIFLYNTLTRHKDEFKPIKAGQVGIYTCGPTVYNYAHLGNLRTFLFEDFLVRMFKYNSYQVYRVANITDVGHLTGDQDMGEDKVEKKAASEGKTAWQIAEFYTKAFLKDLKALNIKEADTWCRATDNIKEQINLVKTLEEKDYTYRTSDGIYFDTSKVRDYNKLSHLPLDQLKEGARVEKNLEKRNPTDFALWKFSPPGVKRQMEWNSPWGVGFPGWHIECSAMSLKYLSSQLDIHCGGVDHINVHHTNEIAQAEAATGHTFFNYWLHGAFLIVKGGKKMAKSGNNFLTVDKALIKAGLNPLAFRFAALQVHYRKPMEYSVGALKQAQSGLNSLLKQVANLGKKSGQINSEFRNKFLSAINDDLNMPAALALVSAVLKSSLSNADKLATILDFDSVLALDLDKADQMISQELNLGDLPSTIRKLLEKRELARQAKNWSEADQLREEIKKKGYLVEDRSDGYRISKLK